MIRVRRNSAKRSRGCMARRRAVLEQARSHDGWKRRCGLRWMAEAAFSSMKRMFGEYVSARNLENVVREMTMKAALYNLFIGMTQTP